MKRYGLNVAISLGLLCFASVASVNAQGVSLTGAPCPPSVINAGSVPDEWFIQGDQAVIQTAPAAFTQSAGIAPAIVGGACPPAAVATKACPPAVATRAAILPTGPHGIFGLMGQPVVTFCGNNPVVGSTLRLYGTPGQYFKAADLKAAAYRAGTIAAAPGAVVGPGGTVVTRSAIYDYGGLVDNINYGMDWNPFRGWFGDSFTFSTGSVNMRAPGVVGSPAGMDNSFKLLFPDH